VLPLPINALVYTLDGVLVGASDFGWVACWRASLHAVLTYGAALFSSCSPALKALDGFSSFDDLK
jgi:hypothetical protein